ncbi:hypothetical protein [Streptomyces sp. WAC08401]|uniref:hypothetical protein n=1 Tax=Streptomyces sp. WAC08401 TaxID=2487413 RepID=UPI000F954B5B|nr:hypothetical protein [Streptomyces sp. WAC08401]RSS12662.1 hypothetical protein EF915_22325 [Streptomyces sp. WAC08401]
MTTHTAPPPPDAPPPDATSDATRLLCAGTYLDPVYRKAVIRELLTERFRVVAPSYGYDAVPVLAHALAAHHLRLQQLRTLLAGAALIAFLMVAGVLDTLGAALLFGWLAWATMFLRRIAVLRTLAAHLAPPAAGAAFDGRYPRTERLTPELVGKIADEQNSETVRYGGYKPFIGAGVLWRRWSNAELLIGAPVASSGPFDHGPFNGRVPHPGGPADGAVNGSPQAPGTAAHPERRPIVPFTAEEITCEVRDRMLAELRDRPRPADSVRMLSVDRRRFTTAVRTLDGPTLRVPVDARHHGRGTDEHWREAYDADREYLCIRIGSWNQELVTTVFVGFDIKGATLHTEFYTYVLAPVAESFHLVDRLPATIDGRLMARIAWDVTRGMPGELLRLLTNPLQERLPSRSGTVKVTVPQPADRSEFRLGRYADAVVDCGARTSVREMAASSEFHHFFQETDARKYTQIVERHLLQIVGDFLREHDVDTRDHEANQTNILQQNFGANSTNNFGGNQSVGNSGTQTFGNNSGVTREARPA